MKFGERNFGTKHSHGKINELSGFIYLASTPEQQPFALAYVVHCVEKLISLNAQHTNLKKRLAVQTFHGLKIVRQPLAKPKSKRACRLKRLQTHS